MATQPKRPNKPTQNDQPPPQQTRGLQSLRELNEGKPKRIEMVLPEVGQRIPLATSLVNNQLGIILVVPSMSAQYVVRGAQPGTASVITKSHWQNMGLAYGQKFNAKDETAHMFPTQGLWTVVPAGFKRTVPAALLNPEPDKVLVGIMVKTVTRIHRTTGPKAVELPVTDVEGIYDEFDWLLDSIVKRMKSNDVNPDNLAGLNVAHLKETMIADKSRFIIARAEESRVRLEAERAALLENR